MRKKIYAKRLIMCLGIGLLMAPLTCYAADDEYVMEYNFETKETTYYGYNYDTNEFYQVEEPGSFQQSSIGSAISDGTVDIAYIDTCDDAEEWIEPGTVYLDQKPIKEDSDNPYAIILSDDGMPTVYEYDEGQEKPWSLVEEYNLLLLEGCVKQVGKTSLTFTDNAGRKLKADIKENEAWQVGDKINVVGLLDEDTKGARLTKQFGYYKVETED